VGGWPGARGGWGGGVWGGGDPPGWPGPLLGARVRARLAHDAHGFVGQQLVHADRHDDLAGLEAVALLPGLGALVYVAVPGRKRLRLGG